jgi:protease-4
MKHFFWKSFGASALATLIVGLAVMFIFLAIVAAMIGGVFQGFSDLKGKPLKVEEKSILHIKLRGNIEDNGSTLMLQGEALPVGGHGLYQMTEALKYAAADDNIKGILLETDILMGSYANIKDLRDAVIKFRETGKFVVAYSNGYSQSAYYLASAADEVWVYPYGYMQLNGLVANVSFIKGMLEKLEIHPQIIRGSNNKFKSAVEPLISDSMSAANKVQTQRFIDGMWEVISGEIAASRKLSTAELNEIVDSLPYMLGNEALQLKLIDKALTREEGMEILAGQTGHEGEQRLVSFYKYCRMVSDKANDKFMPANVAVLYASGSIDMDEGGTDNIGTRNLPKAIKQVREDERIKAVVLRVNSPGGAVLTSDIVYRELVLLAKTKPLIVSMGSVAASGGYYISLPGSKIFASPLTITGSIGVFGVWPNMKDFYNNKLGITFDHVSTNEQGDFGSVNRPLNEMEVKRMQQQIDMVYNDFIQLVDVHRKPLEGPAAVDSIGQGRVWCGNDALKIGLIDATGSLYDAIDFAAAEAGLSVVRIAEFPRYELKGLDALIALIENLSPGNGDEEDDSEESAYAAIKSLETNIKLAKEFSGYFNSVYQAASMQGLQARMIWNIQVE